MVGGYLVREARCMANARTSRIAPTPPAKLVPLPEQRGFRRTPGRAWHDPAKARTRRGPVTAR